MHSKLMRAALLVAAGLTAPAGAFELEMNTLTVNDTFGVQSWTSVSFLQPFDTRPLVLVLPTQQGGDPATLRIRNVTTTGFEVVQTEPTANDGQHVTMNTAYLAIEPGDHVLPNGTRIAAIEVATSAFANRLIGTSWQTAAFPTAFTATPTVVAQIQTMNNETGNPPNASSVPFMDAGIRNVTNGSLQLTLERAESVAGTVTSSERVAVVAIDNLSDVSFVDAFGTSVRLQSMSTPDNIVGWDDNCVINNYPVAFGAAPVVVASTMRRDGNNGGWLRRCSASASGIGLTIDEDLDTDSERSHTTEAAGVIAASVPFHARFAVNLNLSTAYITVSDPVNGGSAPYSIPNAVIEYRINVENTGSSSPDADSVTVVDVVPDELAVCVTATCLSGGPVVLDTTGSPTPPGISIGSVEYSNDGGSTFLYSPTPDGDGFDPAVNGIRVNLSGTLASVGTAGAPSFALILAARIE